MLVLSRKRQEGVTITIPPSDRPTTVHVAVDRLKSKAAALSFEAPRDVRIVRDELIASDSADVLALVDDVAEPEVLDDESLSPTAATSRAQRIAATYCGSRPTNRQPPISTSIAARRSPRANRNSQS